MNKKQFPDKSIIQEQAKNQKYQFLTKIMTPSQCILLTVTLFCKKKVKMT